MLVDYLVAVVAPAIQATCPAVSFFDPMSIDEANRIVVDVPSVETNPASPGNIIVRADCVIKSQWAQPTYAADRAAHFERVNEVRDKLMPSDLRTRLALFAPDGIGIEYVQPRRQFSTTLREGWIVSDLNLTVQCYLTAQT